LGGAEGGPEVRGVGRKSVLVPLMAGANNGNPGQPWENAYVGVVCVSATHTHTQKSC